MEKPSSYSLAHVPAVKENDVVECSQALSRIVSLSPPAAFYELRHGWRNATEQVSTDTSPLGWSRVPLGNLRFCESADIQLEIVRLSQGSHFRVSNSFLRDQVCPLFRRLGGETHLSALLTFLCVARRFTR